MQWLLQSNVRRTQLRFSCAASSCAAILSATPAAWVSSVNIGARGYLMPRSMPSALDRGDRHYDRRGGTRYDGPMRASSSFIRRCRSRATSSTTRTSPISARCSSRPCLRARGARSSSSTRTRCAGSSLRGRGGRRRPRASARRSTRCSRAAGRSCRAPTSSSSPTRRSTGRPRATTSLGELLAALRGRARRPSGSPISTNPGSTTWRPTATRPRELPRGRRLGEVRGEETIPELVAGAARRARRGVVRGARGRVARRAPAAGVGPRRSRRVRSLPRARRRATSGAARGPSPSTGARCRSSPRAAARSAASTAPRTQGARRARRRRSGASRRRGCANTSTRSFAFTARRALEVLDELVNVNERHFDAFLEQAAALDLRFDVPNGMRADYLERAPPRDDEGARHHGERERRERRAARRHRGRRQAARSSAPSSAPPRARTPSGRPAHGSLHDRPARRDGAGDQRHPRVRARTSTSASARMPAVQFATPLPGTRAGAEGARCPSSSDWGPHVPDGAEPARRARVARRRSRRFKWTFDERLRGLAGARRRSS